MLYIDWDISNVCNLSCKYCLRGSSLQKNGQAKIDELIIMNKKKIIKKFVSYGATKLLLSGGEPLMSNALVPIIQEATDNNILTHVTTNGTFLTKNYAYMLINSGVSIISVSLDSNQENLQDAYRGKGVFNKVYQGITNLMEAISNSSADDVPYVSVSTTLIPGKSFPNKDVLSDYLNFCENLRVDEVVFTYVFPVGLGRLYAQDIHGEEVIKFYTWLIELSPLYTKINISVMSTPLIKEYFDMKYPNNKLFLYPIGCPAGEEMYFLSSDLKLFPCSTIGCDDDFKGENVKNFLEDNEDDNYLLNVDNPRELSIFKKVQEIKQKFLLYMFSPCKECRYLEKCHSVCRMHWLSRSEDENSRTYIAPCKYLIEKIGISYK